MPISPNGVTPAERNATSACDSTITYIPFLSNIVPARYIAAAAIWVIAFEFGLAIITVRSFSLISPVFLRLCILTFFGFLIHAHLPQRLRLHFFLTLSAVAIAYVIGIVNALLLFAIGLTLIAVCHLRIAYRFRVLIILVLAGLLMAVRSSMPFSSVGGVVIPVLASMFMFRLIIYLFDIRHEKPGVSLSWRLSYFFMLPNVCFPLFPLVDYKQFRGMYYNQDSLRIYQRGIQWIFRGIYQLLIYRLVYIHLTLDPALVEGGAAFIQYSVSSFLLYLRVSGTFHLATGLMLLFGFNLPETHHQYYLASSFTDFWRRINIYWKDFMRRIVFNTTNFYLRRFGTKLSVILSTAIVFLATWVLHSYQWFWLQGEWLLATHDALFWGLLGGMFIVNFLFEEKFGAAPVLGGNTKWTPRTFVALILRTLATFITMTLLWGLWSSDSFTQWTEMLSTTGNLWLMIIVCVLALYSGSFVLGRIGIEPVAQRLTTVAKPVPKLWSAVATTAAGLVILIALGNIHVYSRFNDVYAGIIDSIRTTQLSSRDQKKLEQGYYEQLLSVNITSGLWDIYSQGRKERIQDSNAWRPTHDVLMGELVPGSSIVFKGAPLSVNRWGMRDKEYSESKPANTTRLAVLGASHVMGSGVADNETFVELIEDRVNKGKSPDAQHFEMLNFAVAGHSPLQYLYQMETVVGRFSPDYVLVISHPQDNQMLLRSISSIVSQGDPIHYAEIESVLQNIGVTADTPRSVIERRLQPHLDELKVWVYRTIATRIRESGARPLFLLMPTVGDSMTAGAIDHTVSAMEDYGFQAMQIMSVYDGVPAKTLQVADWDTHPNYLGHRLVADQLYSEMRSKGLF